MISESKQHGFYFDTRKCIGCRTCHKVCNRKFDNQKNVSPRRVYKTDGNRIVQRLSNDVKCNVPTYYMSLSCNHCSEPACVLACPTGAMHKREKDGLVHVNQETCIGCGSCTRACPYDAPQLDPVKKVVVKCDGCLEQIQAGQQPLCVEACPKQALDFGIITELKKKYGLNAYISSMPSAQITSPNTLLAGQPKVNTHNQRKGNMGKKYDYNRA